VRDFDAYLRRIGLPGGGGIAEIHRAHATAIPFENLDPHRGLEVSLALERIEDKLVARRRGGYCFEHNLLLKAALEEIGAEVQTHLARVRWRANGAVRPRGHLVLCASVEGERWLADVGFGLGTLSEPIPFAPGDEHEQQGWRFRIVQDGHELLLQSVDGEDWADVYAFSPQPSPAVDLETSNWFVSTHPHSPFVTGLIVATLGRDGTRRSLSDWSGEMVLAEHSPAGETREVVKRERVPELLAERFGLEGFAHGADGRLRRS
jgi:N-hydroxyarylamine O-acetyltransferase